MEPLSVQPSVPVRRPLVGIALLFIGGMAAARAWPEVPAGATLAVAAILVAAGAVARRTAASTPLLQAAVLAAGLAHGLLATPGRPALDVRRCLTRPREQIDAVVSVAGAPSRLPSFRGDRETWAFEGRVEAVRHTGPDWRTATGRVRVRLALASGMPPPAYGDRWRMSAACGVDRKSVG